MVVVVVEKHDAKEVDGGKLLYSKGGLGLHYLPIVHTVHTGLFALLSFDEKAGRMLMTPLKLFDVV